MEHMRGKHRDQIWRPRQWGAGRPTRSSRYSLWEQTADQPGVVHAGAADRHHACSGSHQSEFAAGWALPMPDHRSEMVCGSINKTLVGTSTSRRKAGRRAACVRLREYVAPWCLSAGFDRPDRKRWSDLGSVERKRSIRTLREPLIGHDLIPCWAAGASRTHDASSRQRPILPFCRAVVRAQSQAAGWLLTRSWRGRQGRSLIPELVTEGAEADRGRHHFRRLVQPGSGRNLHHYSLGRASKGVSSSTASSRTRSSRTVHQSSTGTLIHK